MSFFEWKDEYCTGNQTIDYQHKQLVWMVNRLYENLGAEGDMRLLLEVFFDDLVKYTQFHFTEEEELMRAGGYPKSEQHHATHQKIANQVLDFRSKFMKNEAKISDELMQFLKNWLNDHILKADKDYVPFVEKA